MQEAPPNPFAWQDRNDERLDQLFIEVTDIRRQVKLLLEMVTMLTRERNKTNTEGVSDSLCDNKAP